MAIPKKGSRKISVDGNLFIWKIKKHPSHNERHNVDYLIPIQHIDGGQILLISTGYNRSLYDFERPLKIVPSIIEKYIRYAIAKGWQFDKKLSPLEIDCRSVLIEEAKLNTVLFMKEIEKKNQDISKKIAQDALELICVGEHQIALENMVDNIFEYNIELNKEVIFLARQAFQIWNNYKYLYTLIY